jgi:Fe2+ or Zn2+ uptake regulation protein
MAAQMRTALCHNGAEWSKPTVYKTLHKMTVDGVLAHDAGCFGLI